jgi:hypothetical protein
MSDAPGEGALRRWRRSGILSLLFVGLISPLVVVGSSRAGDQTRRGADQRRPSQNTLTVGQMAPDFDLPKLESVAPNSERGNAKRSEKGADRIKLSSFRGKKPVVLIFSSYT